MAYPITKDTFPSTLPTSPRLGHSALHNQISIAVRAIEDKLGITSSTDAASIDYMLKNPGSTDPGHRHTYASIIGLGTSATVDIGTTANKIIALDSSGKLPAVDGSQLINLPVDPTRGDLYGLPAGIVVDGELMLWSGTDGKHAKNSGILSSSVASAIANSHTHSNKSLLDTYTQTDANIASAVSLKHSHANKTLLDTYTQTEANLASAVSLKHTHSNKTLLDSLTSAGAGTSFLADDGTYKVVVTTPSWGSITGTLSAQTDLNLALAAKQNALGFTPENIVNKNAMNGYAGLDGSGKINPAQLPSIAITDTFVVNSQVAMLALTAQTGDIAIRTDELKTYILQGTNPAVIGDWQQILSPINAVSSVFGRTAVVTAQSGDYNADQITETVSRVFVTPAQKVVLGNTSNTNSGDETNATIKTKLGVASAGVDGYLSGADWSTFNGKQDTLVSGATIKTVNNESLLGSGNLEITAGSGGYAANVYLTNLTSAVVGSYKQTSYSDDVGETLVSTVVNNNTVLAQAYIFDLPLGITTIDAGLWTITPTLYISGTAGTTNLIVETYTRTSGGTETLLFSVTSPAINNTSRLTLPPIGSTQPSFAVNATDRLVTKVYAKTTANTDITLTYVVGDGSATYFNTPLALRHNQLRARDASDAHPTSAITGLDTALAGKVPTSRSLTINGTAYDLSADRSWTVSGLSWGSSISGATGTGISQTMSDSYSAGGIGQSITITNTQSNALIAKKIDLGSSGIAHTGLNVVSSDLNGASQLANLTHTASGILTSNTTNQVVISSSRTHSDNSNLSDSFVNLLVSRTTNFSGAGINNSAGSVVKITGSDTQSGTYTTSYDLLNLTPSGYSYGCALRIAAPDSVVNAPINGLMLIAISNTQTVAQTAQKITLGTSNVANVGLSITSTGLGGATTLMNLSSSATGTLTASTANKIVYASSRTHTGTTTITDNYTDATFTRTNVMNNASGTFNSQGNIVSITGVDTKTTGSLASTYNLLSLTPSTISSGYAISVQVPNSVTSTHTNGFINFTLGSTQSSAQTIQSINLGTSALAHTGLFIQVAGASSTQRGIRIEPSTTGTGYGISFCESSTGASSFSGIYWTSIASKTGQTAYGINQNIISSATGGTAYGMYQGIVALNGTGYGWYVNTLYNGATGGSGSRFFSLNNVQSGSLTAITGNLSDMIVSRTNTATTGTVSDSYSLMYLKRTNVQNGTGGTLSASGSVLKLENVATQTAGTLTDTVDVLLLNQATISTGNLVKGQKAGVSTFTIDKDGNFLTI